MSVCALLDNRLLRNVHGGMGNEYSKLRVREKYDTCALILPFLFLLQGTTGESFSTYSAKNPTNRISARVPSNGIFSGRYCRIRPMFRKIWNEEGEEKEIEIFTVLVGLLDTYPTIVTEWN